MIRPNSPQAWLLAARPKTLAAAALPVAAGCALAHTHGSFNPTAAALCLAFALLMQVDANFINDLYDFLKGTDRADRLGPERACAQGWVTPARMRRAILLTTAMAAAAGMGLLGYGGWEMVPVGAACILFAFLYTAGPYPLAYHGWGDVLVLVFFGFVPVGCTFYVMAHTWDASVTAAAAACGLVTDTLLMVNNFRDREQDALSGKRTLVVRFGARAGLALYFLLGLAACWCCLWFVREGKVWAAVLPQLYLVPHALATMRMARIHRGRELNTVLGETARNMLLFGLLLVAGLLL